MRLVKSSAIATLGFALMAAVASGQATPKQETGADADQEAAINRAQPPEAVQITTADGVNLAASYYASKRGKEAPVAILLADEEQSRMTLDSLAGFLQTPVNQGGAGFAVLSVDLRGQGDSRLDGVSGSRGRVAGVRQDAASMVTLDLESVRSWLVDKNDAGKLNLNRLAYVGVGSGAVTAINATARDWAVNDLASSKQGRDVKAVAMVSPLWKHDGLGVLDALRQRGVQANVALMVMYGSDDRTQTSNAKRILKQFERSRGKPGSPRDEPLSNLLSASTRSKQSGSALLKSKGDSANELIADFLAEHVAKPEAPWIKRRLD